MTKIGTIIDPRFKKGFRSAENALSAATILEQEMYAISRKNTQDCQNMDADAGDSTFTLPLQTKSVKTSTSTSLFSFLENRVSGKVKSVTADVIMTKRQFLERPNSAEDTDPLLFWKVGKKKCLCNKKKMFFN